MALFDVVSCRQAGFDDCYLKPVDWNTLAQAVGEAMGRLERWFRRGTPQSCSSRAG